MDFKTAAKISSFISKDYAHDFFELLVNYQDISASEAASRLGLHIRTAQDFLEGMAELGVLHKKEVYEKKRPYFRYSLATQRISIEVDLSEIKKEQKPGDLSRLIREKANAGANFSLARGGDYLSHVSLWTGEGRDRKERKISLTTPQGTFLFHLPFPHADYLSLAEIMHKANIEESYTPEILDIVELLIRYEIIETANPE